MFRQEPVSPVVGQTMLGSFASSNPSPDYTTSTAPTGFAGGRERSLSPLKLRGGGGNSFGSFGSGFASPRSLAGQEAATEVQRRAAEWERQIEHLDAKELEIHQTQLRLVREQTQAFRKDFAQMREELQEMKASIQKQQANNFELTARWDEQLVNQKQESDERLQHLERSLQRLSDDAQIMKRELRGGPDVSNRLQAHEADLKLLKDSHADMKSSQGAKDQHHATLQQRVEYLEKIMGESADKHTAHMKTLEELQGHRQDQLGRHSQMAESVERLRQEKEALHKRHSSMEERMRYLEQLMGDSADRHAKDLKAHKEVQGQQHASLEERMKYIEKVLGDSAEEHAKLLAKHKKDLEDHKQSFLSHQRDFDEHRAQLKTHQATIEKHATLEQRLDFLEKAIGDSAQQHMKQLQAHKADVDQKHQAHSSIGDRVEYIEKWSGGPEGHPKGTMKLEDDETGVREEDRRTGGDEDSPVVFDGLGAEPAGAEQPLRMRPSSRRSRSGETSQSVRAQSTKGTMDDAGDFGRVKSK
ncbi:unnamed protein product [Durusdinium trenchii]|uniref:Uncharacterized protein n=1 Tax=Durusdinium trenchii TaxID=1381693 RepID=A0ABP0SQ90_9DINO